MEDTKKPQQNNKPRHMLPIIVLVALVVIVGFVLVRAQLQNGMNPIDKTGTQQDSGDVDGRMYFQNPEGRNVFATGEEIVLDLYIDSSNREIGGYDAVFTYESDIVQFDSVDSLVDNFKTYPNSFEDEETGLITTNVTGISELESETPFPFENQSVARLTFKALAEGTTTLTFMFEEGETSDSNIVLLSADDILGAVENFDIVIGDMETLRLNQTYASGTNGLQITLDAVEVPGELCADCQSTATLTVIAGGETETLTFTIGGIAGKTVDSKTVFGNTIEVSNIVAESVSLSIAAE